MYPTTSASAEDGYVPMGPHITTACLRTQCSLDDYIPMSSGSIVSPLPKLPADLEPPPVNRDLKPQRKRKPCGQACCVGEGSSHGGGAGGGFVSFLTLSGKETLEELS